jgi:hypothetical protein
LRGELALQDEQTGVRITADVPYGSPTYQAVSSVTISW